MDTKQLARVMKALSNPNRLELYLEILKKCEATFRTHGGECMVSDIMCSFSIGAPTISHHLKELSDAGLIITERKGKFLVARINDSTIGEVAAILAVKRGK
ncbi:MAG TPA: metalloregulator ArsR/SmtB family transcription factor [Spirochaetota bacterium]|nr:metalloregulator ArsR/SmtB family transcription factor [Spirochaetota bacterium]HRZ27005.1 metalloregulator ArsR/SmtB family transcription factor [Spirochaetota bacterium]HSA16353.1 metalloregulator ArsR/SmtB family transcription factor [Spirochaetota bacterium]